MSYRYHCIAVVVTGIATLLLGSWLLGEIAPNLMILLLGALLLALFTTQGMLVAILMLATRRERASTEARPR